MMLDQLRHDMQRRLDDLLDEADKLRQALLALGPHEHAPPSTARDRSAATRSRRATSTGRRSPRATKTADSASPTASVTPANSRTNNAATPRSRMASGETKHAVLAALGTGTAMTASDVAKATRLGRASVSTTLSKLAKAGEVTKAARGYVLAD